VNNAAERKTGWHFVNDSRNQKAFGHVNGGIWLAKRVHQEMRLRQRFFYSNERWRMDEVHAYEEEIKTFRRNVMPPVHMGDGQPVRGTKFVTIQYKNGANGNIRGIFIDDEIVALIAMYNKTTGITA
jgi:hypothetical protein